MTKVRGYDAARDVGEMGQAIAAAEAASGIRLHQWNVDEIGESIGFVRGVGIGFLRRRIEAARDACATALEQLENGERPETAATEERENTETGREDSHEKAQTAQEEGN